MVIFENPTVIVPGERWEAPLVARTRHSLLLVGLPSVQYEYRYGDHADPHTYESALDSLLERQPASESIVIPAGFIAGHEFGRLLRERVAYETATPLPGSRSPFSVVQPGGLRKSLPDMLLESLTETHVQRDRRVVKRNALGRHLQQLAGTDLFQRLEESALLRDCEPPVKELTGQELASIRGGWVYRCNNEPIEVDLSGLHDCRTLVVVGAGIKPWWIANELRHTLQQVIVVDSHIPQLAFAFHAMQEIGRAPSWSAICDGMPFHSINDLELRPLHDRLYRKLRDTRSEWKFTAHFFAADLQCQTFGILDLLKTRAPGQTCFWYSNVFRPYTSSGHSEHHAGVESSFLYLFKAAFPGLVSFNTGSKPVQNPESDRLRPDLTFRLRRSYDAVAARWLSRD